jgi:ribosomal protein S18 acetylase RimI-like enzyme
MARPNDDSGVTVRDARPDEAPLVANLIRELAVSEDVESGVTSALVRAYQEYGDSGVLVAELDGEVVATLTYFIRPGLFHGGDWGYIDELVVTAAARGRGAGDALVTEAMRRFEAADCKEAAVATVFGNDRAAALYRKHGLVDEALQLERHFDDRGARP